MKRTYYVTYAFEGRYVCKVKAENIEDAKEQAESEWFTANFSEVEILNARPIIVEDENDIIWEG